VTWVNDAKKKATTRETTTIRRRKKRMKPPKNWQIKQEAIKSSKIFLEHAGKELIAIQKVIAGAKNRV